MVVRKVAVFREKQGINLLTGHPVTHIDRAAKVVAGTTLEGKPFEAAYDKLLIATGAAPILPAIPGIEHPGVMVLKTLADGRHIKQYLNRRTVASTVIIGMGYIALEMCETLRTLGLEVAMVKPGPRFLPWLKEELAEVVAEEIKANGAAFYPGHRIARIENKSERLQVACEDLTLEADMVLMATGVYPNSEIAAAAGIELGPKKSIAVDRRLMTSDPHVYAAGDCADAYHVVTGQKTWIPLALRANRSGWAVADNVGGRNVELPGVVGTAVFKIFDLQVARTGLSRAEALATGFEPMEVTIKTRSRAHAHPGASTIHVTWSATGQNRPAAGRPDGGARRGGPPDQWPGGGASCADDGGPVQPIRPVICPAFRTDMGPMLTAANQLLKKL